MEAIEIALQKVQRPDSIPLLTIKKISERASIFLIHDLAYHKTMHIPITITPFPRHFSNFLLISNRFSCIPFSDWSTATS